MTWTATRHDLWPEETRRVASAIARGELQVVQGGPGSGKTALLFAVAKELGHDAVVVRVPQGLDQVERVILQIAERFGPKCLLEVDRHLQGAAGGPERALDVLERAFNTGRFLLLVDDIDTVGAVDWEARSVFEERFSKLRQWLHRRARLCTTEAPLRDRRAQEAQPIYVKAALTPPCSLRNGVEQDLQPLWEAAHGDLRLFGLALSRSLLTEDKEALDPERLETDEILSDIWSVLSMDMRQVLLHVAVHQRPLPRKALLAAVPDVPPAAVDEAHRALLLEQEGEHLWAAPWWGPWCARKLSRGDVALAHERLADAFSAGLVLDDPNAGLRAMDILDAHRHFAAIPDLRRARHFARYGVTVLLERARELSYQHDFKRAAGIYEDVLFIDEQLRQRQPEGIGRKPRAYARHYFHYNEQKADSTYPPERAEQGYVASLEEWPENALFWSRLVLARFYRSLPDLALRTLEDALRAIPAEAEQQLRARTVDRLVRKRMLQNAIAVWGDFRAETPNAVTVERHLLSALERGWEAVVLRARGETDLYFHDPVRVSITRVGREYACEVHDLVATARGPSPERALAAVITRLRREADELNRTLTHTLSPERVIRKGLLLSRIDLVMSELIEGVRDHGWVLGWLERRDGELVFVGSEEEVYGLDDGLGPLAADNRLRFARVRTGTAGEPVGPVEALEEPFHGDPSQIWQEFQRRVSGHDG